MYSPLAVSPSLSPVQLAGLTTEKVIETIEKYEPAPEARKNRQMLIDGESISTRGGGKRKRKIKRRREKGKKKADR